MNIEKQVQQNALKIMDILNSAKTITQLPSSIESLREDYEIAVFNKTTNKTIKAKISDLGIQNLKTLIDGAISGFKGPISIADTPTEDGVYPPVEAGTYPNAGGLVYDPEGTDKGYKVTFIKSGADWVKDRVDLGLEVADEVTEENTDAVSSKAVFKFAVDRDSVFVNDAFMKNEDVTNNLKNSVKKVSVDNIDENRLAISLLYVSASKLFLNLKYFNASTSTWDDAYYHSVDVKTGLASYSFETTNGNIGKVTITIDMDYFNSNPQLNSGVADITKAEIVKIERLKDINTANIVEKNNLKPVTSNAVYIDHIDRNSIFVKDAFMRNSATTLNLKENVKSVTILTDIKARFAIGLLELTGTNLTLNVRYFDESSDTWKTLVYSPATKKDGLQKYRYVSTIGTVILELDTDKYLSGETLTSLPADYNKAEIVKYTTYDEEGLNESIKGLKNRQTKSFIETADIKYAGNDLNDSYNSAIKRIEISGDYLDKKLFLASLTWDAAAGKLGIAIAADFDGNTSYQKLIISNLNISISNPNIVNKIVFDKDQNNQLILKHPDLRVTLYIIPSLIKAAYYYSASDYTYEKRGLILHEDKTVYPTYKAVNLRNMLNNGSSEPLQYANSLPYRLNSKSKDAKHQHTINDFTPMWDAWRLKTEPIVEHLSITPPTVVGHFNDHAVLGDIGLDDTMYFYGVSDKKARIYKSIDEGVTLIEIVDLKVLFDLNYMSAWGVRVLPNNELLTMITVRVGDLSDSIIEKRTYAFVSSNGQTVWNQVKKAEDGTNFHLDFYKEVDGSGKITYQNFSRWLDGWCFDSYRNFVMVTQYGSGEGVPNPELGHVGVGYLSARSLWLSDDYGLTFKQVFDYMNMPEGCTPLVNPKGGHHSHGCFIDHYKITNGFPRIIGIFGDEETRLVWSDDGGATWRDNRNQGVGYSQAVSGMATPYGYIMGTDGIAIQGIELVHRGDEILPASEIHRTLSPLEETLNPIIVHVGMNFYQRGYGYPIVTGVTPESTNRYNAGSRGQILASFDGGLTYSTLYTDDKGYMKAISAGRVFQDSKFNVWVSPSNSVQDLVDGLGLKGRMIKITYK